MSAALLTPPAASDPPRKRFTRAEVDRLLDMGFFEGQRFELIDGDLIDKMGQKPPHIRSLRRLHTWIVRLFGPERVLVQLPVEAGPGDRERSVPEPDIAVVAEVSETHDTRLIRGDELLIVIEIADTSAKFDATIKRNLYARAAVPEYWVLDIPGRRMLVHRNPVGGAYTEVMVAAEQESIAPVAAPDRPILISELLP